MSEKMYETKRIIVKGISGEEYVSEVDPLSEGGKGDRLLGTVVDVKKADNQKEKNEE